jgi:hypothetical protein
MADDDVCDAQRGENGVTDYVSRSSRVEGFDPRRYLRIHPEEA